MNNIFKSKFNFVFREGEAPDSVAYFPSMDYGIDSNRTLELQDLVGIVYIPSMDYGIDSNRTLELQDLLGIVYIPSMNYGIDSNRTLELQDLIDIQFNEIY